MKLARWTNPICHPWPIGRYRYRVLNSTAIYYILYPNRYLYYIHDKCTKLMYDWFVFVGQVQAVDPTVRRSNTSQLSDGPKDGSVLRRVAKVTLDQATKDQKPVRPKHVPEKLDFRNREKFEGKRLYSSDAALRVYIIIDVPIASDNTRTFLRCESNCILHETGFRLFFGYDQRDRKVEKKIPASLGKKPTNRKRKRSTVITASCTNIEWLWENNNLCNLVWLSEISLLYYFLVKYQYSVLGTFFSVDNEISVRVVCCESVSNFLYPVRLLQVGVYIGRYIIL